MINESENFENLPLKKNSEINNIQYNKPFKNREKGKYTINNIL